MAKDKDHGHGENDHDSDDGYYGGHKISIKKEHRGLFTSYCRGLGHMGVTKGCIAEGKKSENQIVRKQAVFAENAKRWRHPKKEDKENESK